MLAVLPEFSRWAFFKLIFDFLDEEIEIFRYNLMNGFLEWATAIALVVLTLWILIQGFLVVSGRSRESMMGLVIQSLRAALIVSVATTMAWGAMPLYEMFSNSLPREVNELITGDDKPPQDDIDKNLGYMSASLIALDALDTGGVSAIKENADRAKWMTTIGVAGPSVVASSMMLLYKIALALFIGFGPLFVLCLMFDQTKALFSKWLLYGIGTMFSFSVLCFMVSVATKIVGAAAAAFAAQNLIIMMSSDAASDGVSSMAMQQGGIGLILTTLIIGAPPMAAMFFQGTLGSFSAYSQMGTQLNSPPPQHQQQAVYQPQIGGGGGDARPAGVSPGAVTSSPVLANVGGREGDVIKSGPNLGQAR
jgi:type IV secretion system protein VirB6